MKGESKANFLGVCVKENSQNGHDRKAEIAKLISDRRIDVIQQTVIAIVKKQQPKGDKEEQETSL